MEWATLLATVFAAVAAVAAAVTTLLDYQRHRVSLWPTLIGTLLAEGEETYLRVMNVGPGSAQAVRYFIVDIERGTGVTGHVGRGYLAAGQEHEVELGFTPPTTTGPSPYESGEVYGMWWCGDARGGSHFWTSEGGYRRYPKGRLWWKQDVPENSADVFEEFFPIELSDDVRLIRAPRPTLSQGED